MFYYITSNKSKIATARKYLTPYRIEFEPKALDLVEIQSHSLEEIAIYKAKQAFTKLSQPLIVNDTGWTIPALHGFPGSYMKYMNEWLTAQDFLNLMRSKTDRTVFLKEIFCYVDSKQTKTFVLEHKGDILTEAQGDEKPYPFLSIVSFTSDAKSAAQSIKHGQSFLPESTMWKEFAEWYRKS